MSLVALNGMASDLATPHGRMMATLLAGIAEFERESPQPRLVAKRWVASLGRSYRLVGREVGLSKNTVAGIVKRSRAAALAALVLYFAAPSAWAQAPVPKAALQYAADSTPRTRRACAAIAAVANRGARALRAADLVSRNVAIDLGNDGHPRTIVRLDGIGTAHQPYLADEAHHPIDFPSTAYYEAARWADKLVVIQAKQRIWRVDWYAGSLDGTAALVAATDGTAICRFHTTWQAPTLKLLPGAEPGLAHAYRTLLLGKGLAPPTAGLDPDSVQAATNMPPDYTSFSKRVEAPSWHVDLMNNGKSMTLTRVDLASGAGSGCDFQILGLVQNGGVVAAGFGRTWLADRPALAPATPELQRQLNNVGCSDVAETPLLDQKQRAYVLFDNVAKHPDSVERVSLLAGARKGTMRALARLSWKAWNVALLPTPS